RMNDLPEIHPVVRMSSVDHDLHSGLCGRLAFKYSISLIGPVDFSGRSVPAETPPCGSIAPPLPDTSRSGAAPPRPSCVRLALELRAARAAARARAAIIASSEHN